MIPDLSVLWVIFFVLLITTLLNLLLFKPLLAVKGKREGAVKSARALAESAAEPKQAAEEFECGPRPPARRSISRWIPHGAPPKSAAQN